MKQNKLRILVIDIETSPLITYTWGLFDQNISLGQVKEDWHILSFAAKILNEPKSKVIYMDQRKNKTITDDKQMLQKIWELLDSCDVLIGQNSKKFDTKKINAKLIENGFPPYSPIRQIDTLVLAKKYFAFTSNKLEYMSDKLCTHKKLKTKKFQGFALWKACLSGNQQAWKEMQEYNIMDILATEELYNKIAPWGTGINFSVYNDDIKETCNCGSTKLQKRGFNHSNNGRYQRFQCQNCGSWSSSKENLLTKEKRESLKK